MDFNSIEFYTILLVIAFALLGVFFSPKSKSPASTYIVGMDILPSVKPGESAGIKWKALENGFVKIFHDNVLLHEGETVNLVATVTDDSVRLLEKKGVKTSGLESSCTIEATLTFLKQRTMSVRYESEVSGQWCTFQFTNAPGNEKDIDLKF